MITGSSTNKTRKLEIICSASASRNRKLEMIHDSLTNRNRKLKIRDNIYIHVHVHTFQRYSVYMYSVCSLITIYYMYIVCTDMLYIIIYSKYNLDRVYLASKLNNMLFYCGELCKNTSFFSTHLHVFLSDG